MPSAVVRILVVSVALAVLFTACGKDAPDFLVHNQRPTVELIVAPTPGDSTSYVVELRWIGHDTDGYVTSYEYALDPPASPSPGTDTAWVATTETRVVLRVPATRPPEFLPPPGSPSPASDYHTVVLQAIDREGLHSEPIARSFTAWTVAPSTLITVPDGTSQLSIATTRSFRVSWHGEDPDGTDRPVSYRTRLVRAIDVDPVDPWSISSGRIQAFFEADAPEFAATGWDSLPGDSTGVMLHDLEAGQRYFLAVVAFDEAGAYEPRFDRDRNVLDFTPTDDRLGPRLLVWNEYFSRQQSVGGIAPSRIWAIESAADVPVTFHWAGSPPRPGTVIDSYRWALDIADVYDETPRSGPTDLRHWTPWSALETSATIGPFPGSGTAEAEIHDFHVEARDNYGQVTLVTIRITVVEAIRDRALLVLDDLYGVPTQSDPLVPGGIRLSGSYPLEAEQDSFYVARGGFPDSLLLRSGSSGLSATGAFADYWPDTLDYRFWPEDGVSLAKLARYRAVCWYTDGQSAARNGSKFGSVSPMTALRSVNSSNRMNTLAAYVRQGGHVWLFGEGATPAIANGWYSRIGGVPIPPYTAGRDPMGNVLVEGNFLHDFVLLRSELSRSPLSSSSQFLRGCVPFLPSEQPDQPGAGRTALRWQGLPRLTIGPYRTATPASSIAGTWWISRANHAFDIAPGYGPAMDTLYTFRAVVAESGGPDGFPNAVHVRVSDGRGQVVWFGFPLHFFDREQVRRVVDEVMRNFGIAAGPSGPAGRPRPRR